nr:hypothetical protein [Lachnospiraceae bacterium]
MKEQKFRKSLKGKMFRMACIPLVALGLLTGLVASIFIRKTMEVQIRINMEKQCDYILNYYDSLYPGEFTVEKNEDSNGEYTSVKLYKGTYDITTEYDVLDAMKNAFGDDYTIFARAY